MYGLVVIYIVGKSRLDGKSQNLHHNLACGVHNHQCISRQVQVACTIFELFCET